MLKKLLSCFSGTEQYPSSMQSHACESPSWEERVSIRRAKNHEGETNPPPYTPEPNVPIDQNSHKSGPNFFTENVARNSLKSRFLAKEMLRSTVRTPICQIVPVSRVYPPPQKKKKAQFAQTNSEQFVLSRTCFPLKRAENRRKEFAQTVCMNSSCLGGWFFGWVVFP